MEARVNENELIKAQSHLLRVTLRESIADELTGALAPADAQICKFHGFYEQDDRDHRLPYHPLWERGYVSVGDIHSTRPLEPGMREQDTRFFGLKRECGLHE